MLGVLLESQARHTRRVGGSVISLVVHGGMLAAAILATAPNHFVVESPPPVEIIKVPVATPPRPVPVAPAQSAAPSSSSAPAPVFEAVKLPPMEFPTTIPLEMPDFKADATPTVEGQEFRRAGDAQRGPLGVLGDPGAGGVPGGTGTWSESEIALHLASKPTPPRYPGTLQRLGVEGRVLVRFVVDTTCRVDMTSIEVVESSHDLFTAAVRTSLPDLRFRCAQAGDRKTRVLAVMPFVFQMTR